MSPIPLMPPISLARGAPASGPFPSGSFLMFSESICLPALGLLKIFLHPLYIPTLKATKIPPVGLQSPPALSYPDPMAPSTAVLPGLDYCVMAGLGPPSRSWVKNQTPRLILAEKPRGHDTHLPMLQGQHSPEVSGLVNHIATSFERSS